MMGNPPPFAAKPGAPDAGAADPSQGLSPHLSPHSNAASGYSFENLMYNLISNRQRLQKKEEEVKNRMAELEAEDEGLNLEELVQNDELEPPNFDLGEPLEEVPEKDEEATAPPK